MQPSVYGITLNPVSNLRRKEARATTDSWLTPEINGLKGRNQESDVVPAWLERNSVATGALCSDAKLNPEQTGYNPTSSQFRSLNVCVQHAGALHHIDKS